jgi:putative NADPH-quinone reductase
MKPMITSNYNDKLFIQGYEYTIGTNDGAQFRRVRFTGTKLYHGKPMMTFKTTDGNQQITINPSFHSYTIQETITKPDYVKVVSEKKEEEKIDG